MGGIGQQLIQQRGIPIMPTIPGLPFTQGNVYHVKPGSGNDGNYGDHPESAFKTLSYAHGKMTANQNDVCLLYTEHNTGASTTDYQSTALTWSKNSCHLIGVNGGSIIGSRARIAQTSTVLTIEDLVTLSANNCLFSNLEIFHGVATSSASSPRAFVVSGQRNVIKNSQISGNGDAAQSMDTAGACSLAVTGGENLFESNYIGLDTALRTTAVSEVTIGTSATRTIFDKCIINSYVASAATTFKALTIAAGSYHTATWLKECMLCSETNRTGATAAQTGAILHSAAGNVFMLGGGVFGYLDVSTLANANIFMLAHYGLSTAANFPGVAQGVVPS
jgi:hypothetical protein